LIAFATDLPDSLDNITEKVKALETIEMTMMLM
jgi:hypothetical protein